MSTVDAFIEQNVQPEHRELVALLREIMRAAAPEATEQMSYGLPMWKNNGYLAYLSPSKQGILFGFPYGAAFMDVHNVLRGKGKHARHIRFKRADDVAAEMLRTYIAQARAGDRRAHPESSSASGPTPS